MQRCYLYEGSRDEALRRVDAAMTTHAKRFPRLRPTFEWTDRYRAQANFHVPLLDIEQRAELRILPDRILVDVPLPRLLRVFRERIQEVLDRHARAILADMLRGTS